MNEQLMQALSQLLSTISAGITEGVSFAQEQLPDVILQLLWWEGVKSFLYFSALISLVCLTYHWGFVVTNKHRVSQEKKFKEEIEKQEAEGFRNRYTYDPYNDQYYIIPRIISPVCLFLWVLCLSSTLDWLKILIAPKVWLIEYASSLVR